VGSLERRDESVDVLALIGAHPAFGRGVNRMEAPFGRSKAPTPRRLIGLPHQGGVNASFGAAQMCVEI
jgi:hypothetical protein